MKKEFKKNLDDSRISLAEAMDRTNFWREATKPLFNDNTALVPKGFYIPFEDIMALAKLYPQAAGVRAYFTLPRPGFKKGEGVSGVLVPVEYTDDDIYKDILTSSLEDNSTEPPIFDFTKPCPDCCDPESELF